MITNGKELEKDVWGELKTKIQTELDYYRREKKEIDLKVDQSRQELERLAQRNVSISANLQHVQSQIETTPRNKIRKAYDTTLDAQQRLFQMRGQTDKMESEQVSIEKHIDLLETILQAYDRGTPGVLHSLGLSDAAHTVEMMIQSQEAERQRLSRQMHDGPAQALSNFILQTEIAMRQFSRDTEKAREELENLKLSAMDTFQKVRHFIFELRPMMLDDLGLAPTLKRYLETLKVQFGDDLRVIITGKERRFESYQEVMVFRAVQELANNALQYSQANYLKAQLDMGEETIKVTVDDDGVGFDVDELEDSPGMGLKVIRDRVEMLGGNMEVDSTPGQGTRITFQIPANEAISIT